VKKVTANMYIAVGQGAGGSAMDALNANHEEMHRRTKEITDQALSLLDSEPKDHSDDELATIQRRIDGHIVQLGAMKEKFSEDLDLVRTGMAAPHPEVQLAAQLRNMHGSRGWE
jgi:hypothetical protein